MRDLRLDELVPEQSLHELLVEIAQHFDVPIGLVNVVDSDLAYSTASCGVDPLEIGKPHGS